MACGCRCLLSPHSIRTKSSTVCIPPCPLPNLCLRVRWKDRASGESKGKALAPHQWKSLKTLDLWETGGSQLLVDKVQGFLPNSNGNWYFSSIQVSYPTFTCIKEAQLGWGLGIGGPVHWSRLIMAWPWTLSKLWRKSLTSSRSKSEKQKNCRCWAHSCSPVYWRRQHGDLVHSGVFIELRIQHEACGHSPAQDFRAGTGYPFEWIQIPKFSSLGFFFYVLFFKC